MADDPAGHYATLEVDPAATPDVIAAAYRRKARVLHPDVVGTGNAAAFMRVKAAYDVLGDVERRAVYDRSARAGAALVPAVADDPPRGPRLSDLPVAVWAGLGGIVCLATIMAVLQLSHHPKPPQGPVIRPFAPSASAFRPLPAPQATAAANGPTTHYVLPSGDDTVLWRHDAARDAFLPAGHVAAFSPVRALRLVPQHGLVEISLADGGTGFIDATRLAPGDRATARQAYCAYNAGPSPGNGAVLGRHGDGTARLEISNRGSLPMVVKLRDASGQAAATVFVAPAGRATVENLPDTAYRPDFAVGELWSQACNGFAAGMRAQRFAGYASPSGLSPLVIPPDLSVGPAPEDIPDAEFERE